MNRFTQAIVRVPSANLAEGISSAGLGRPDLALAFAQHAAYCDALRACGLEVLTLPAEERHPDATFVEDTAVIAGRVAVIARPGAASRLGEERSILECLRGMRSTIAQIRAPGTLDGGDVCQAEDHFFVGVSARTNPEGAGQFCEAVRAAGYTASTVDIRTNPLLLHLKSGVAYLGEGRLLAAPGLPRTPELTRFEWLEVPAEENYAANAVRINDRLLVARGFAGTARMLEARGYATLALDVSEFRKLDGGLSCLSLRF